MSRRELRRRKAFKPAVGGVDEAVFDLDMMAYGFQLFTDVMSGVDSVVYRDGLNGYRISSSDGNAAPNGRYGLITPSD